MKFPIDIYFFNTHGGLVSKNLNCQPGIDEIESESTAMFAVEVRSKNVNN